jgi:hypothetical protein
VQLLDQDLTIGDVLDHDDAGVVLLRAADRDDRGKALAVLALEGHVELALAAARRRRPDVADLQQVLGRPVGQRRPSPNELVVAEAVMSHIASFTAAI